MKFRNTETPEWKFKAYFGQYQDEKIINKYLGKDPDKEIGTYVDIGAGDCSLHSNTYYYYLRNWKGLLVEPFNEACDTIRKYRPEDILEQMAITDYDGTADMVMHAIKSSVIGQSYATNEYKDKPNRWYSVPCLTINSLIQKYPEFKEPDICNMDIETNEDKALSKCNFDLFRPKIIYIEKEVRKIDYRNQWEKYLLPYYDFKEILGGNALYLRRT